MIRLVAAMALLALLAAHAPARADDAPPPCADAPTPDMKMQCLNKAFSAAEKDLITALALATTFTQNRGDMDHAQSAWLQYRDAECSFQGDDNDSGPPHPDRIKLCMIAKDTARAAELRADSGAGP